MPGKGEMQGDLMAKVGETKKFTLPGVVRGMVCVAVSSKLWDKEECGS
jgi:hypothetical protein